MVVSTEPLTNLLPSKCKHRTSPEWPVKVITDHGELVLIFQTRMVLSWLPLTMRPESNWTQDIAAEWPSKVRTWHWPEKNHFLEEKKIEKNKSDYIYLSTMIVLVYIFPEILLSNSNHWFYDAFPIGLDFHFEKVSIGDENTIFAKSIENQTNCSRNDRLVDIDWALMVLDNLLFW